MQQLTGAGIAEIGARAVAAGLDGFAFGAFILRDLFLAVGIGVDRIISLKAYFGYNVQRGIGSASEEKGSSGFAGRNHSNFELF